MRRTSAARTDTMDTFVDSSWYFYRTPTHNDKPFDTKTIALVRCRESIDIGGVEHAILHLVYSASDQVHARHGLGENDEPVKRLFTQDGD
jgi:leucyl-tRNA synthetase